MADADKNLTIAIKTTADTSGAVATERAIDQVGEAAKDAERAVEDLATAQRRAEYEAKRAAWREGKTGSETESRGFGGMLDSGAGTGTDTSSAAKGGESSSGSAGGFDFGKAKGVTSDDLTRWKAAKVEADSLLASIGKLKNAAMEIAPHVAAVYGTLTSAFGQDRRDRRQPHQVD